MRKRDVRGKLELRRERLRQLTELSTEQAAGVVGGDLNDMLGNNGRAWSKTCR
ncbi:MAG TPA: hypothetical protein VFU21_29715 [Kofleriaceae bacterium]|nr:hypothetical protein [Kofleriaceae bacterium]